MTDNNRATEKLDNVEISETVDELTYHAVPAGLSDADLHEKPAWRLRLDVATNAKLRLGLDIYGDIILGRDIDLPDAVDISPLGAKQHGVSRRHVLLHPTPKHLFITDLGSTNGTLRNGRSIGVQAPYSLVNGDILTLGDLSLVVNIIDRPRFQADGSERRIDFADALSQIAKSITSQLDLDEVLNQVVETAMTLTAAGATSIWLADERTGELFLEVEHGINDVRVRRKRLPVDEDSMAGKVLKTGKPLRAWRQPGEEQIKVVTNYLVEALAYVPITLGRTTFGVLAATHREGGKRFDQRDERLLVAIADFAAIAIQNARSYEATDKELARRYQELSALSELARSVTSTLNLHQVFEVLARQINRHWPVEAVYLYLPLEGRAEPQELLWKNEGAEPNLVVDKAVINLVLKTGDSVITRTNATTNKRDSEPLGVELQSALSMAGVPLLVKERIVGVLALVNGRDGTFSREDMLRLEAFAYPVATAVENARLFWESERQRAAIMATSQLLAQPLLIIDDQGSILVANKAANQLMETSLSQLLNGISQSVGGTAEVTIGSQTFLTSTEHVPEIGTIAIMQDITAAKELEEARANFIHMLSHDLKNPMTSITGWTTLLDRTQNIDSQGQQYLLNIGLATKRMLAMVNQLLSSVSDQDVIQVFKQPCDVEKIVNLVLADSHGSALHKQMRVDAAFHGAPYPILADDTRLYHMLLNLVDNAIKYAPADTRVQIDVHFADTLTIRVQDEGGGIPDEDLDRIFDRYYRSKPGIRGEVSGSGVGLAVVKTTVEEHGGTVTAANKPEGGAVFTIELPESVRLPESASQP